jgi:hypothetical protein
MRNAALRIDVFACIKIGNNLASLDACVGQTKRWKPPKRNHARYSANSCPPNPSLPRFCNFEGQAIAMGIKDDRILTPVLDGHEPFMIPTDHADHRMLAYAASMAFKGYWMLSFSAHSRQKYPKN